MSGDDPLREGRSSEGTSEGEQMRNEFVRLLLQHERRLYAYILSLVPNWNDADEIYQETVLRLWKEFDRFDTESNFAAWAIQVAYFQILTWRKKVKRSKLVFGQETIELIVGEHARMNRGHDARHRALGDCIEKLSWRSRDVLARCYADGASVKEVAQRLNRTSASIYKALQRIRLALHKCISERLAAEGSQ